MSPVTPVLPPKNSLATGNKRTSSRPSRSISGSINRAHHVLGLRPDPPPQRVVEPVAVVDTRSDHDLPAHLDAVIEKCPQPAQAHPTADILEHPVAHVMFGGVDRDVQRRQPLGDHPLEI